MRIALLSSPTAVNSNYRAYQPMMALSRRGHEVKFNRLDEPIPLRTLLQMDVVHIHRIAEPEMRQVASDLHDAGVGVVWDNDDDVTAVPKTNPLYKRYGGPKSREMLAGVKHMVRSADVVTTPSTVLAEQYRELGA